MSFPTYCLTFFTAVFDDLAFLAVLEREGLESLVFFGADLSIERESPQALVAGIPYPGVIQIEDEWFVDEEDLFILLE
jgi:hypothetical protein